MYFAICKIKEYIQRNGEINMTGRIHSLESFGTVDGPGVRFVVFFQGCPMRCLYCHNPDTWEFGAGTEMTVDEIMREFDKCKEFLANGGITATGGEPLTQLDFLTELFEAAKAKGIHTCLDTSGITFTPNHTEKFERLIKSTDLVMLDIKHIDPQEHIKLTSQKNDNILKFAEFLRDHNITMWIRHVVVPGITDNPVYLNRLGHFLAHFKNVKALDVLPYHDMGKVKYENLGIDYPLKDVEPMSKDDAVKCRDIILQGIKDELHGIKAE